MCIRDRVRAQLVVKQGGQVETRLRLVGIFCGTGRRVGARLKEQPVVERHYVSGIEAALFGEAVLCEQVAPYGRAHGIM